MFRSLKKEISFRSRNDLLDDYRMYDLLKNKGLKEEECLEILEIHGDSETYFRKLEAPFLSSKAFLDGKSFRSYVTESESMKAQLRRITSENALYAVFLFVMSLAAAFFFDHTILPMISDSLALFDHTDRSVFHLQIFLKIYCYGVVALLITGLLYCLHLRSKQAFLRFYETCYRLSKNNLLCRYYSLYFAIYYEALLNSGANTKQIVESLSKQNSSRFASFVALQMEKELKKGKNANEVIGALLLDPKLLKAFEIGNVTGELRSLLKQYIEINQALFLRKWKKAIQGVQYAIYVVVSLMIALLYRALMSPLGAVYQL